MSCLLSLLESKTQVKNGKCSVGKVRLGEKKWEKEICICRLTVCGTCHLNCILGGIFGLDTLRMTFCCFVLFFWILLNKDSE